MKIFNKNLSILVLSMFSLCSLGILGFFDVMLASVTAITLRDFDRILATDVGVVDRGIINDQRIFPLYIDSA